MRTVNPLLCQLKRTSCSVSWLRGFTLIELMVTVAIVATLAMVAAPSFNQAILSNKLNAGAPTILWLVRSWRVASPSSAIRR